MDQHTPTTESTPGAPSTLYQLMTLSEKTEPADARINNRMMVFSMLFPQMRLSRGESIAVLQDRLRKPQPTPGD